MPKSINQKVPTSSAECQKPPKVLEKNKKSPKSVKSMTFIKNHSVSSFPIIFFRRGAVRAFRKSWFSCGDPYGARGRPWTECRDWGGISEWADDDQFFQNVNTRVGFENLQKQSSFDVRIHEVADLSFTGSYISSLSSSFSFSSSSTSSSCENNITTTTSTSWSSWPW